MKYLGTQHPGRTVYIDFDSFAGSTGASITLSGLAVTDVEVYRDGSTTQRSSDNGYALQDTDGIDVDGITGIHGLTIDLSDNSDAGFWRAGSYYRVVISTVTVDSQTVSFTAATFRIGYESAILNTTIATLSSQTSFTLTAGPAEDDALNGMWACIHDVASAVQKSWVQILDYTGSTKTVTLAAGATFTAAATDNFSVMGPMPVQPTTTGRTLDVSTGGEAGVDWANVGSPTTTVGLSGTTVKTATDVETDTADIQSRLPAALGANGNIKADLIDIAGSAVNTSTAQLGVNIVHAVGVDWTSGAISASVLASGTITSAKFAAGAIDAAAIAANAIGASELAADAVAEIADAVWDEALIGHSTSQTFGAQAWTILDAVKAKTDNLPSDPADASDIASSFSTVNSTLATIAGYLDTEIAAIVAAIGTPSDLGSGATLAANLVDIEGQTDDIGTAGAGLTAIPWNAAWDAEVQSEVDDALKASLTEGYRSQRTAGSVRDLLYEISSHLGRQGNSGTTRTIYKLDTTTPALTFTYDDGSNPTEILETA